MPEVKMSVVNMPDVENVRGKNVSGKNARGTNFIGKNNSWGKIFSGKNIRSQISTLLYEL